MSLFVGVYLILSYLPPSPFSLSLHSRTGTDGTADISYHIIKGGISEMRTRGLLKGVRAMANRVYAGQRWWVEGHRSHIECLYRRQSNVMLLVEWHGLQRGSGGYYKKRDGGEQQG